ncbi:hypothetical protein HDV02_004757 [Globomyces sp. JEL0801]|nr:hypothetical protein HDV02_004757 [Globomyces sp. JEL0801]
MSIVDIEPDELDILQDKQTKALTGLNNIKNSHIEHLKVLESLLKNQSNTVIQLQKQLALARESENTLKEEIQSARKILNSLTTEIDNSDKNGQYILNTMKTYTRLHKYTDIHSSGQIQSHQSSEDAPIINVKVEQGSNNHTTFTSHTKRSELLPSSSNNISPNHEVAKKESSISFTTIFDRPKPIPSTPFNLSESDSRSLQQTVKTVHELPVMSTKPNRSEKQTTEHQAPKSPVIKLESEYSKDSTEIANKSVEVSTVRVKRETDDSTGFGTDKRVKVEQLGSQLNSSQQDVFMVKLKQLQSDSGLGNGQTVKIARKIASESICYYYNALGCERDESLCMLDHVCAYCSLDHPLHL